MMTLLLLNDDTRNENEICDFFSSAGYQINWSETSATFLAGQSLREQNKSITILQIDHTHPFLPDIANLTQGLMVPWRLSLHQRTLTAPNNNKIKLTSLEFTLIKTFALLEVGEVASRKKIIDEFGEHYLSYDQNRLDTMIMRLRKKIRHGLGLTLPLNTVRVRGFSFDDLLILDH
ncbi:Transcriptional regulatory protein, C terminal [Collimonas sp. OK242]|jgi:DNA-binding response OmpR family regulator|nr:Transcriptional regulatory protein, C terminal [Collimonas sp. OK242]